MCGVGGSAEQGAFAFFVDRWLAGRQLLVMRKPVPIKLMMVLAMSLTACGPAPKPPVPAEVPEADAGDSVRKKTGEIFTVVLNSNPTTAYRWALDGKEDATLVRKLSDEYLSRPHPPGMVGVGGTEH